MYRECYRTSSNENCINIQVNMCAFDHVATFQPLLCMWSISPLCPTQLSPSDQASCRVPLLWSPASTGPTSSRITHLLKSMEEMITGKRRLQHVPLPSPLYYKWIGILHYSVLIHILSFHIFHHLFFCNWLYTWWFLTPQGVHLNTQPFVFCLPCSCWGCWYTPKPEA